MGMNQKILPLAGLGLIFIIAILKKKIIGITLQTNLLPKIGIAKWKRW